MCYEMQCNKNEGSRCQIPKNSLICFCWHVACSCQQLDLRCRPGSRWWAIDFCSWARDVAGIVLRLAVSQGKNQEAGKENLRVPVHRILKTCIFQSEDGLTARISAFGSSSSHRACQNSPLIGIRQWLSGLTMGQ